MLWRAGCIACAGASFDCSDRLALGRTLFLAGGASCKEGLSIAAPFLASFGRSGPTPTAGRSRRSAPRRSGAPARTPGITYTYDANGNQITRDGASQAWASFNLPVQVAQPVGGTTYLSQFSYGPDRQRWKQVASYSNGTETTYYVGGLLEKESPSSGATQWRHYVHLPSGMAIVVARASNNQKTVRYLLVDHLGSTDKVLNEAGAIVASYSYGVYGNRRGSDWGGTAPDWSGIANSTRHGYTGHEHLDNLLLIHMNGRVYDPGTGRFLSVDPIMADLGDSQQVNPYAYVGNRPLEYTDPSGFSASADDEQNSSDINYTFDVDIEISMKGVGRWLHRVGSGIAHFLGFNQDPPPPPATVMQGQSAQTGTNPCGAGRSSAACGGVRIEASPDAAGPSVAFKTADAVDRWGAEESTYRTCPAGCAKAWTGDPNSPLAWQENTDTNWNRLANTATLLAAIAAEGVGAARTIDPTLVRFSQSSMSRTFRNGGSVDELAAGLRNGTVKAADIPPVRLVERNGQLFSLDNRRLWSFQQAQVPIPYRMATPQEAAAEAWKFTTQNEGVSILLRGGP